MVNDNDLFFFVFIVASEIVDLNFVSVIFFVISDFFCYFLLHISFRGKNLMHASFSKL